MKESNFHFTNPIVRDLKFGIHEHFKSGAKDAEIQNSVSVKINNFEQKQEAIVELSLSIGDRDNEDSQTPFFLDMIIGSKFTWTNEIDEDTIKSFLSKDAPALLLSYARPIVANITNVGPFQTYNLPFFNFSED